MTVKWFRWFSILSVCFALSLTSCSDDNDSGTTPGNHPPTAPYDPIPADSAIDQALDINFSWSGDDPDDDPLTYRIYFDSLSNPQMVNSDNVDTVYTPLRLRYQTTYYWGVVARDDHKHSSKGPIWSFTTIAEPNRAPGIPFSPNPPDSATGVLLNTIMSWECIDYDDSVLVYDVYLDSIEIPQLISSNQIETSFKPADLKNETKYYWKIVAKDENNNRKEGPVWTFTTSENYPPDQPGDPLPPDNATDVPTDTSLSWSCSDPDNDPLVYAVYFGTSTSPPLVSDDQSAVSFDPGTLSFSTYYYWRIVAKDNHDNETFGQIWSFATIGQENRPPLVPTDPVPQDGATDVSTTSTLSWSCIDPDGDPMDYDIHFGTETNPPLVMSDQTSESYDPGELQEDITYYWKITAKDDHGHQTVGVIWSFTTGGGGGNLPPTEPSNPVPPQVSIDVPLDQVLSWDCSDPENDPLEYRVYFGEETSPPLVTTITDGNREFTPTLNANTRYFWKIVADDNQGNTTSGSIWTFRTE